MFRLGLCSVTFREKSTDEVISIVQNNGLAGIEWGGDVHVPPRTPAEVISGLVRKCRAAGLSIPSYGSYFNALDNSPEDFVPILETASLLGADTIRIWAGWVRPEKATDKQLDKIASTSSAISDLAAKDKIRVAFEFHDNTPTEGGDNALRVLNRAGNPNLYTYFQTIKPNEIETTLDNLEKVYPRLAYVHVQNNDGERNLPLQDYRPLWKEILKRLKKHNYSGWLFFEFNKDNSVEQLAEDIAFIRELMG